MPVPSQPVCEFLLTVEEQSDFAGRMAAEYAARMSLSRAQINAVERIMVERGWTLDRVPEEDDVWTPPSESTPGTPAERSMVSRTPNGVYQVSYGDDDYHYRIFTITSSRTESLVGKRVISMRSLQEDAEFETLGYLTTDGGFRIWQRHVDQWSDSIEVLLLRAFLVVLHSHGRPESMRSFIVPLDMDQTIATINDDGVPGDPTAVFESLSVEVIRYNCQYCNHRLVSDAQMIRGLCGSHSRADGGLEPRFIPSSSIDMDRIAPPMGGPMRTGGVVRPQFSPPALDRCVEIYTSSELSSWEQ